MLVAVGAAGGESVRNMSVVWGWKVRFRLWPLVRVVVVHVVPWVEAAAVYAVLTVIAVVPVLA